MSNYPQLLLSSPIAVSGDKTIPPATAQQAGTGRFSQEDGWGSWNSLPIGEGGVPPKREDFNGAFYILSQLLYWYQQGGVMQYSATLDYEPGNEVFSGGVKYRCLIANGPNTDQGVVAPASSKTVWSNRDLPSVLAGQVTPFYNCKIGGSDGRRLIPWGSSDAYETYVLCDGGSDGMGGNVPNLIDRFILPSSVANAGQTGGALTGTTDSVQVSGTVGATTLTIDQIPSHSHTGTAESAGSHTHSRGTIAGTGSFWAMNWSGGQFDETTGCFYTIESSTIEGRTGSNNKRINHIGFDLSRQGSGQTGAAGAHTHTLSIDAAGGGGSHTHTLTGATHAHQVTFERPPFYRLAYFVKLPE